MDYVELSSYMARIRESRYKDREGVRWLSLDWDAWTGDGFNCGCCGFCKTDRPNPIRRGSICHSSYILNYWEDPTRYFPLHRIEKERWFAAPMSVIVTECHADLSYFLTNIDHVVNIDFHSDSNPYETVHCGSWADGIPRYQRCQEPVDGYQYMKNTKFSPDIMSICMSSPWTYRKSDKQFFAFVLYLANFCMYKEPLFFGHKKGFLRKKYLHSLEEQSGEPVSARSAALAG